MTALSGKRILVVEDEFLVAAFIEDVLSELGAVVIGPVYRIQDGISLARKEQLDAAILDINLNGQRSDPISDVLIQRRVPFILATGYGSAETHLGVPVLDKPYTDDKLVQVLSRVLSSADYSSL